MRITEEERRKLEKSLAAFLQKNVANRIRALREITFLGFEKFSLELGFSRNITINWENGSKIPSMESIGRLIHEYIEFIFYNEEVYRKAKELLEGY